MTAPTQSFNDWSQQLALDYWQNLAKIDPGSAGIDTSKVPDRYVQQFTENTGLRNIWQHGVTPDQIMGAPFLNANMIGDAGGYGAFQHTPYDQMTAAQKATVDKYGFHWVDQQTDSEGNPSGGYWDTQNAPGVGGQYPGAAFQAFDPFHPSGLKNPNQVIYDPNYGLLTTAANEHQGISGTVGQYLAPILMTIASMGFGALGFPAAAAMAVRAGPTISALTDKPKPAGTGPAQGGASTHPVPGSGSSTPVQTGAPKPGVGGMSAQSLAALLPILLLLSKQGGKGKGK